MATRKGRDDNACQVRRKESILEAIRERARSGRSVRRMHVLQEDSRLVHRAACYYGNWSAALAAAGYDPEIVSRRRRITEERLRTELTAWVKRRGPLHHTKLRRTASPLHSAVLKRYGSVRKAASAFGLPFNTERRRYSKAEVASLIQKAHAGKHRLTMKEANRTATGLAHAAKRHYGSWEAALHAAGFDSQRSTARSKSLDYLHPDQVIQAILRRKEMGQPLHYVAVRKEAPDLASAAIRFYRNWGRALDAAGLDDSTIRLPRRWNRNRVLEEIRNYARLGVPLQRRSMSRINSSLVSASYRLWGGWYYAVEAAGFPAATIRCKQLARLGGGMPDLSDCVA